MHDPRLVGIAPQVESVGLGDVEATRAEDRHHVGSMVVGMVDRLGHGYRRGQAPAVAGDHIARLQVAVPGDVLPARAQAADALRKLVERHRACGHALRQTLSGDAMEVALFGLDQVAQGFADRAVGPRDRGVEVLGVDALAVLDQAQRRPRLVSIQRQQRFAHFEARSLETTARSALPPVRTSPTTAGAAGSFPARNAASGSAPVGSSARCSRNHATRTASAISSSVTVTMSSTRPLVTITSKVLSSIESARTPSARVTGESSRLTSRPE